MGPQASRAETQTFRRKLVAGTALNPLTCPTYVESGIASRHIDLRPFKLSGAGGGVQSVFGGLTRVVLKDGSLVINSSQGGSTKDP